MECKDRLHLICDFVVFGIDHGVDKLIEAVLGEIDSLIEPPVVDPEEVPAGHEAFVAELAVLPVCVPEEGVGACRDREV